MFNITKRGNSFARLDRVRISYTHSFSYLHDKETKARACQLYTGADPRFIKGADYTTASACRASRGGRIELQGPCSGGVPGGGKWA